MTVWFNRTTIYEAPVAEAMAEFKVAAIERRAQSSLIEGRSQPRPALITAMASACMSPQDSKADPGGVVLRLCLDTLPTQP